MKTCLRLLGASAYLLALTASASAQKDPAPQAGKPAVQPVRPAPVQPGKPAEPKVPETATHEQARTIAVASSDGKLRLQTLALDSEGRVLGLVAQPRHFNAPAKDVTSEVHVITPEGKTVSTWTVKFHAHSINVAPDGTIFVAGDGKVAKFDRAGKQLAEIQLPHIQELLKDQGELRKQAEAQVKQQKEARENILKQYKQRKEEIEKIKEEDRTPLQKRQLQQYEQVIKNYAQYQDSVTVDSIINQQTSRLRIINGIAISEKDLYIVCGETKGYGYAIWRMSHDFKEPRQVLNGVRGCCGQMDVQVSGNDFLLAENCNFQFARYDRDGKKLGGWGERGRGLDDKGFGGCCNPMNIRIQAGDIFTAESEGVIKRWSAKGDFVGLVGKASLQGGCKNVAVAVSKDAEHVFFCDQPGSRVIVLAKKKSTSAKKD